jgi:peptidoglycan/LPS O-acetylase OafA/YrhL
LFTWTEMKDASGQSGRISSLDGLRAISIVFVFFGHIDGTRHASQLFHWLPFAEFGVRVFFVLSGFLITSLLLKELEVTQKISLKNFYMRRVFRIFPASYTYILVILILAELHAIFLNAHDMLHAVTYTSNYYNGRSWYVGHLWSLSVEEQFYLLWPLTLGLSGRRHGMWIAAWVCLLVPFIRAAEFHYIAASRVGMGAWFETAADCLAIGCLLAGTRDWLSGQRRYIQFLSSKFFVIVPIVILGLNYLHPPLRYKYTLLWPAVNLGIALCIDACIRFPDNVVGRFLNWRPVVFVGVLSYSLYLWQQPFLDRNVSSFFTAFPFNVVFAFFTALASYYLIEKPFLRLKKHFEIPSVKKTTVASAGATAQPEVQ